MEQRVFKVSAVVLGVALAAAILLTVALSLCGLLAASLVLAGAPASELGSELAARSALPILRATAVAVLTLAAGVGASHAARLESAAPFRHALAVGLVGVAVVARLGSHIELASSAFPLVAALVLGAAFVGAGRVAHRRRWSRRAPDLAGSFASGAR